MTNDISEMPHVVFWAYDMVLVTNEFFCHFRGVLKGSAFVSDNVLIIKVCVGNEESCHDDYLLSKKYSTQIVVTYIPMLFVSFRIYYRKYLR